MIEIAQYIKFGDLTVVEAAAISEDNVQASWSPNLTTKLALPTVQVDGISDSDDERPRLSDDEEDALVRDSTSGFAIWVTSFIRRVILLLENLPEEDPSANPGGGGGGTTETTVVDSVMDTCSQICVHLSDSLFDLVLDLVYDFATTTVRSNAVRAIHQLVACVANANPQKTVSSFCPRPEYHRLSAPLSSRGSFLYASGTYGLNWSTERLRREVSQLVLRCLLMQLFTGVSSVACDSTPYSS